MTGIPCKHAISCMFLKNLDPHDFVNDLYKITTYKKIYETCIAPMSGADMWDDAPVEYNLTLMPPKFNLGKKFQDSFRCKVCWQYWHNSRFHKKKQTQ